MLGQKMSSDGSSLCLLTGINGSKGCVDAAVCFRGDAAPNTANSKQANLSHQVIHVYDVDCSDDVVFGINR